MLDDIEKKKKEMMDILEEISLDDISSNKEGISIQVGKRIFKFKEIEILPVNDDMEVKLRNEFRTLLNSQQQKIREKINQKISQLMTMYTQKQNEIDRKENELIKKYANIAHMPDILLGHVNNGLSVCKADAPNSFYWIYKGSYNPKFMHIDGTRNPLDKRIIERLKRDMLILIRTKANKVTEVSTRQPGDINRYFEHYHQAHPDCWGNWKYPSVWTTADDILKIAKDAEAVLESINRRSVASRSPVDMPRIETLETHIRTESPITPTEIMPVRRPRGRPRTRPQTDLRGRPINGPNVDENVWTTDTPF